MSEASSRGTAAQPPSPRGTALRPPAPRLLLAARVPHGGVDYAELAALGIRPENVLDFSVNSNPLGASPRALRAIDLVDLGRYPDPDALRLRAGLAAEHDVRPDEVLDGNGSVELIWLLAQSYLGPGDRALVVGPTFGEYAAAALRTGAEVVECRGDRQSGFRAATDAVCRAVTVARPRLVFVCTPNNPTGHLLELAEIERILAACDDALVVVDEAYLDFADGAASALALRGDPRVVVLRSLTKNFGLAGLRLGYLVADRSVVEALSGARPPWTVNALAQAAGLAALGDREHLAAGVRLAKRARAFLVDGLERLGLPCLPSRTNYWLVEVAGAKAGSLEGGGPNTSGSEASGSAPGASAPGAAATLRADLLRRGILVRDCASFGLPNHIRVAARPLEECQRLLDVLTGLVSSRPTDGLGTMDGGGMTDGMRGGR